MGSKMTLQQWITKYEQEAEEFDLLPGFSVYYEPDKGFFCWHKFNHIMWAHNSCMKLAKEQGCTILRTATKRPPAVYMRKTKAKLNLPLSGLRVNGEFYWIFDKEVI
jgi:hypothetical protein